MDLLKKISRNNLSFFFDKNLSPIIEVEPGETFIVETEDNVCGRISSPTDLPTKENLRELLEPTPILGNPVNGPIYIKGAKKGDVLEIEIIDIIPNEQGWTGFVAEEKCFNPLRDSFKWRECHGPYVAIIKHIKGLSGTTSDGKAVIDSKVLWDLKPFIGTIAVAPETEIMSTVTGQGPWGGNIDCREVCKGNKIYLPVFNDGALLFLGDVHASQADSEFMGIADECRATVFLKCNVIKNKCIPYLRIVTPNSLIQINNGKPLDSSITQAIMWMMDWLVEEYSMDRKEVCIHMSINPEVKLHVYQMVGNLATVGIEFPRIFLK